MSGKEKPWRRVGWKPPYGVGPSSFVAVFFGEDGLTLTAVPVAGWEQQERWELVTREIATIVVDGEQRLVSDFDSKVFGVMPVAAWEEIEAGVELYGNEDPDNPWPRNL